MADLKIKLSKCDFWKTEIEYLGHIVSPAGVRPMPQKIQAVLNIKPPTTVKEAQSALGVIGFVSRFVPMYSETVKHINKLTRKNETFKWSDKCQHSLDLAKHALTHSPTLIYPDPNAEYHLFTDASMHTWSAILMQYPPQDNQNNSVTPSTASINDTQITDTDSTPVPANTEDEKPTSCQTLMSKHLSDSPYANLQPVAFQSGTFQGSQLNWSTLQKEAAAIHQGVRRLSFYLYDADVSCYSDHKPLRKFIHGTTANHKINNWSFEIHAICNTVRFRFIKGSLNYLADAMSRLSYFDLYTPQPKEPEGYEFGKSIFAEDEPWDTTIPLDYPAIHIVHLVDAVKEKEGVKVESSANDVESSANDATPTPTYNFLSKSMDVEIPPVSVDVPTSISPSKIKALQERINWCKEALKLVKKRPANEIYGINSDGLLYRKVRDNNQIFEAIIIPPELQKVILHECHEMLCHPGTTKLYLFVRRRFYWKGLKRDCVTHVRTCPECQAVTLKQPHYVDHTTKIPQYPMACIAMDLIGPFDRSSTGCNRCLTCICLLTGFLFCAPIPDKETETVVQAYLNHVYAKAGGSEVILSDRGKEFKSKLFQEVASKLGVKQAFTSPRTPKANSVIERCHSYIKNSIAKLKMNQPTMDWDFVIHMVTYSYNITPRQSTGESSWFLFFGRDPYIPRLQSVLSHKIRYYGDSSSCISLDMMNTLYEETVKELKLARDREPPDLSKVTDHTFQPGDRVLLRNFDKTSKAAFTPKYEPSYRIIRLVGGKAADLVGPTGQTRRASINHLVPLCTRDYYVSQTPQACHIGRQLEYKPLAEVPQVPNAPSDPMPHYNLRSRSRSS